MALKFVDVYSGSADSLVTDPNAQGTIIKVSQGTYYVNPKFQHQWDLANGRLWVAKYPYNWRNWNVPNMNVQTDPWPTYTLWQFAGEDEDRSVANVDEVGWQKIANPSGQEIQYTKPAETQAPAPQSVESWVDELGVRWFKEDGTFTLNTAINLRWGATTQSSVIAQLPAGSSVNYDAFCYSGGYVWIRQPRGNGQYGYLATGNAVNGKRTDYWGKFE